MPKLTKKAAAEATTASEGTGSYEPLDPGRYVCKLVDVEAKEGLKGPYWSWSYEVARGEGLGRKLWDNTSMSEAARWRLGLTFAAFGVDADTDTDELVGEEVALLVDTQTIQAGKRAGELGNVVAAISALTEEERAVYAEELPEF
jgi:hypothetical protein